MPKHAFLRILLGLLALSTGCGETTRNGGEAAPDGGDAARIADARAEADIDASAAPDANGGAGASPVASADSGADGTLQSNADAMAEMPLDAGAEAAAEASSPAEAMGCGAGPDSGTAVDCGAAAHAACGFANCPMGCCDSNGVCQPGSSAAACGGGGSDCQVCPAGSGCAECPPGVLCQTERSCACTPESCPNGCCLGGYQGACQAGILDDACGSGGTPCVDCTHGMAIEAEPGTCSTQQCVYPAPCPFGCLDAQGVCRPGSSNTQCGTGGVACTDCTASGAACAGQGCLSGLDPTMACNQQTCPSGCCDSFGNCQLGSADAMCGTGGVNCQDCPFLGESCSGKRCGTADGGVGCGWFNCGGCCDSSGVCVPVDSDTQCGGSGSACVDCTKLGDRCIQGDCTAPDGTVACYASCLGCCDGAGVCQLGFIDTQCGQRGAPCQDCTSETPASTCDLSVARRTCTSEQTTCPASYPGCPTGLQAQAVPKGQGMCSTTDLANAMAACAAGPSTGACFGFAAVSGCGQCLQPFLYDFTTQVGVRACAAPFLDPTCSHSSGCLDDCLTQACAGCVLQGEECSSQAQAGTCAPYVQANACVAQALAGAAAVCNPAKYQGSFGAWLQAVGEVYCGP